MDLTNHYFQRQRRKQKWKLRWPLHSERKEKLWTYGTNFEPDPVPSMELVHFILGKKEKKKYPSPQLYPDAVKDILWESSSIVGSFY